MISSGSEQDLHLNPGLYSVDEDEDHFNTSDWNYEYFCRIYDGWNFPIRRGVLIPIDDSLNGSCLNNRSGTTKRLRSTIFHLVDLKCPVNGSSTSWRYEGVPQSSLKSSLTIVGGSLRSNRTYQWMVMMENKRNHSLQGKGYLLDRVEQTFPQLIAIG